MAITPQPQWFICQLPDQTCQISNEPLTEAQQTWGPFSTLQEAIRRRVGLIRAGTCLPQMPAES